MLDRTDTIRRILPADLSATDEAAFWAALDQMRTHYAAMVDQRERHPAKIELKRWERNLKLIDQLQGFDPFKIAALRDEAETHIAGYTQINGASRGHAGLPQLFLYPAVLDLWCIQLQQPLTYARSSTTGEPSGALINFFLAVVKPLLGAKSPTKAGIAAVIDRERKSLDPAYRAQARKNRLAALKPRPPG